VHSFIGKLENYPLHKSKQLTLCKLHFNFTVLLVLEIDQCLFGIGASNTGRIVNVTWFFFPFGCGCVCFIMSFFSV